MSRLFQSDNYLSIRDYRAFDSILQHLSLLDNAQCLEWEQTFDAGFKSMQTIFDEHITSDIAYYAALEEDTTQIVDEANFHCPEMMNELGKMYYAEQQPEGGYIITLNIAHPFAARLVNKNGIVKVGDYIFQFTKDYDKYIPADRPDLIPQMLLATSSATDQSAPIVVREGFSKPIENSEGGMAAGCNDPQPNWWHVINYNWFCTGYTTFSNKGKLKIEAKVYYTYAKVHNCASMYTPNLFADIYSYKRGFFGGWHWDYCNMTTNLSWSPNHPVGMKPGHVTYWANNNTHRQWNSIYFQDISFSTYSSIFNPNNFYLYSTRSGGPSGGSTYCSH